MHSLGPHGSQDGMLDGPRRAVIVDDNLLVCDINNHHVSCSSLEEEFKFHLFSVEEGITGPFGIDFRFPHMWLTEVSNIISKII